MQQCDYRDVFGELTEQLRKGAFLVTEGNPMTIGWAQLGVVWGKPVCTVFVRPSRYSHALMEKAGKFTLSIPAAGTMGEELAFCGSKSGRDVDKTAALGLKLEKAQAGGADALAGCAAHLECRVLWKTSGTAADMDPTIRERFYGANQATPDGDVHTVYFAEILAAYRD